MWGRSPQSHCCWLWHLGPKLSTRIKYPMSVCLRQNISDFKLNKNVPKRLLFPFSWGDTASLTDEFRVRKEVWLFQLYLCLATGCHVGPRISRGTYFETMGLGTMERLVILNFQKHPVSLILITLSLRWYIHCIHCWYESIIFG